MNTDKFEWDTETLFELINYAIDTSPRKGIWSTSMILNDFMVSKLRKPILVTEDGVPQYKEDRPWYVNDRLELGGSADLDRNAKFHPSINVRYFSTQEIAEQYILENKPCLSLKDIKHYAHLSAIEEQQLLDVIKEKIGGL